MKCKEYEIKIKDIKKQNTTLEIAKRKISEILRQINYVPFSASDEQTNETNPQPGIGSPQTTLIEKELYLSNLIEDVLLYKSEDIIVPNKTDKEITWSMKYWRLLDEVAVLSDVYTSEDRNVVEEFCLVDSSCW